VRRSGSVAPAAPTRRVADLCLYRRTSTCYSLAARLDVGKHAGVCPDAGAPAGSEPRKAAEKIAKEESKKVAKICGACGGADKLCDGAGDIPLGDLYGPVPACPAVTLPGPPFTACGGITITTLQDLVDCLDCVAEHQVDCTTANQVPSLAPYPPECS
jgi:hypothetical protein